MASRRKVTGRVRGRERSRERTSLGRDSELDTRENAQAADVEVHCSDKWCRAWLLARYGNRRGISLTRSGLMCGAGES
jgi:hypothetical protein